MWLEARAATVNAIKPHSVLILFVNSEKQVTSTLLMEDGKQVWTKLEIGQRESDDESGAQKKK